MAALQYAMQLLRRDELQLLQKPYQIDQVRHSLRFHPSLPNPLLLPPDLQPQGL
jgi:hypothetical protein